MYDTRFSQGEHDKSGARRGKKDNNRPKGNKRGHEHKKKPDEIDMNRQLKDYWSNLKDSTKTDEGTVPSNVEKRQITSKKFNDEMDDYWKKQKKEEQEPAPPAP